MPWLREDGSVPKLKEGPSPFDKRGDGYYDAEGFKLHWEGETNIGGSPIPVGQPAEGGNDGALADALILAAVTSIESKVDRVMKAFRLA